MTNDGTDVDPQQVQAAARLVTSYLPDEEPPPAAAPMPLLRSVITHFVAVVFALALTAYAIRSSLF